LRVVQLLDPIVTLPPSQGLFAYEHLLRRGASMIDGDMVFMRKEVSCMIRARVVD
jgi:hypothetical protein